MTSFDIYNRNQELQVPPADQGMSFDVYNKPTTTAPQETVQAPPNATGVDWADIGKGAAGGLGRGVAGTIGLPGTLGGLARAGLGKAGVPEEALAAGAKAVRSAGKFVPGLGILGGPSGTEVQQDIEGITGKFYEPKTVPGQYASTAFEFAPGMVIPGGGGIAARVANTVIPAVTSETAGQITKGTAAEPYARVIGGVGGGLAGAKLITPIAQPSVAYRGAVANLEREGIPLTAGQRTGSKPLQWMEATAADMPLVGRNPAAGQAEAFDRAVTRTMFDPRQLAARSGVPEGVALPDPRAVTAGRQSLSDEYTRLTQGNQLRSDLRLQQGLYGRQAQYERDVLPSQRTGDVEAIRNDIVDRLVAGQGQMPGDVYQATRSRIGTAARGTQDPQLRTALRGMREDLDRAMERGLSPADAAAWRLTNQRWGNMRQTEGAVAAAGENLSPMRVAQSVKARRPGQYAAQDSDLDRLAKAASIAMKPLPQSGTAPRMAAQQMFNLPNMITSGGGGLLGTMLGGPVGGLVGAAMPFVAQRAVGSRLGQAYLGNQALPQNVRDIVTQTLAQQAIARPRGRIRAEDDDEKKPSRR